MGLFSKKRRTTTETKTEKKTLSKIVKLSYLQTLAIDGGLADAREVAGETQASEITTENQNIKRDLQQRFLDNRGDIVSNLLGGIPDLAGNVLGSLFGKKRTTDVKVNVKESGWQVKKTWNQPQFDIVRYAIGIKELTVAQFTYEEVSEFVSKPWGSPKDIIKATLVVDQFIPTVFPPGNFIKYYIKPNIEGAEWMQINPLGLPSVFNEDGSIVPRIVNFNTERPLNSRLEDAYIITSAPVKEMVFRAVLSRPSSLEGTTASADGYSPILRSYRLLMYPANGL